MSLLNELINKIFHHRTRFTRAARGQYVGRRRTRDDAFKFRMGAGFLGDVNRTHPVNIEPCLQSQTPATAYGQAVVIAADGTNGVRPLVAGDNGLTDVYGFTVRPFPLQMPTAPNNFGGTQTSGGALPQSGTPLSNGAIDVMRQGYMFVKWSGVGPAPVKGGQVDLWVAANAGNHVQGITVETTHTGGSSISIANCTFNGPADANNIVEIVYKA